ncbi:WD40 repeat domain-containing serine/threonine protein kinase [Stieleria varia]|uniref:Serine/threonine-protein kinase PrkC n=1 Tax=Stieleria varia TaxID=2528005 RepID=A0A5C5ZYH2_9BACT|nr:WD40 repeat domain-containing serine/threonine protein kinase [Stieleria varia]TWT91997.1 Serine/threonine-protein kinase PrkC [Stieleria varia]
MDIQEIDRLCDEFERRVRGESRLSVEDFLRDVEGGDCEELIVELLKIEAELVTPSIRLGLQASERLQSAHLTDKQSERAMKIARLRKSLAFQMSETFKSGPDSESVRIDPPNKSFGEYEIEEEISRGGMGIVYRARHTRLNRVVALKMILAGQLAGEVDVLRFQAEAEMAAQLDHPNIVPIFEVGQHDGQHYFSMGFVEGESLAQRIKEGPFPSAEAAEVTRIISEAIAYAHRRGVIHRDLKPANILLATKADPLGSDTSRLASPHSSRPSSTHSSRPPSTRARHLSYSPKITDFGLAKKTAEDQGLTATGQILGTPAFMPPEQACGEISKLTETGDVYSLGAILYTLLVGRPPFQAASTMDTILQVRHSAPVPPRQFNPSVPRDLETICLKCLEKDGRKRYGSATDLADELQRYLNGEPILARPVSRFEHAWRLCLRNPVIATLSGTAVLLLVVGTIVSAYFAVKSRRESATAVSQTNFALEKAEQARIAEGLARERLEQVEAANAETEQAFFQLNTSLGLTYAQQNQPRDAMLWFSNAARIARPNSPQARASLVRVNTWQHASSKPLRMLWHDGEELQQTIVNPQRLQIATLTLQHRCTLWDPIENISHAVSQEASAIDWSPDGSLLAVGCTHGNVLLIDSQTKKVEATISLNEGSGDPITAVRFGPDGSRIALANSMVRVWDIEREVFITPPLVHPKAVQSVCFSSTDPLISTACEDNYVRLFPIDPNIADPALEPLHHMLRIWPMQPPYDPCFVGDGRYVATLPRSNATALVDVKTGKVAFEIQLDSAAITRQRLSRDGRLLAVVSSAGAQVWDCQTRSQISSVDANLRLLAIRPDNAELLVTTDTEAIGQWSIAEQNWTAEGIAPELTGIEDIAYTFDGERFVTSYPEGMVCLWAMPLGEARNRSIQLAGGGSAMKLSRDGQYLLPTGAGWFWGNLHQTQLCSAADLSTLGRPLTANALLIDCDITSDNETVATASYDAIEFWNWRTAERITPTIPLESEPLAIGFPLNSKDLIVVRADATISKFDTKTGESIFDVTHGEQQEVRIKRYGTGSHRYQDSDGRATGYPKTTRSLHLSDDGDWFVSGALSDEVHVRRVRDGSLRYPPLPHDQPATATGLSADERFLATASGNNAYVWDFTTGSCISPPLQHSSQVNHAVFSSQGDQLLTLTNDGTALLWNWRTAVVDIPPLNHEEPIFDGAFVSDGEWLVTVGRRSAKFWSRQTGRIVTPPVTLNVNVTARVLSSRDDTWVFVSGGAGSNNAARNEGRSITAIPLHDFEIQPDDKLIVEIGAFAELIANKRIDDGVPVPLNSREWRDRFTELLVNRPEWFDSIYSP